MSSPRCYQNVINNTGVKCGVFSKMSSYVVLQLRDLLFLIKQVNIVIPS